MSFSKAPLKRFNDGQKVAASPSTGRSSPLLGSPRVRGISPGMPRGHASRPASPMATCLTGVDSRSSSQTSSMYTRLRKRSNTSLHSTDTADSPRMKTVKDEVISNDDTQSQNGVNTDNVLTSITDPEDTKPEPPEVLDPPAASTTPSYIPRSTIPVLKRPVMARAPNTSDKTQGKAMETQFFNKKRKFTGLKKELEEKQRCIMELYSSLVGLQEKVRQGSGKDLGVIGQLKLVDFGGDVINTLSGAQTVKRTKTDGAGEDLNSSRSLPGSLSEDQNCELVKEMQTKLQEVPELFNEICEEVLNKGKRTFQSLMNACDGDAVEKAIIKEQMKQFHNEGEDLLNRLEEATRSHGQTVSQVRKAVQRLWEEHEAMKDVRNQFEKKHQLIVTVTKELQDRVGLLEIQNTDLGEKLRQCSEDLVKERVRVEQINEKKNLAEKEAKEDKQKLKQMEKKMAAEEGKLVHLTSQMGALESQLKIKDQVQDQRIKEMQKMSKHTSDSVSRLEKEKIQLQLKVEELGNSLREKKEKAKKIIDELNAKLHKTDGRLTEEETSRKKLVQDLERAAQTIANIEKKRLELEHTIKHNSLSEEVKASMREVELMTDLQTTKEKLTSAEEVIVSLTKDSEKLKEMIIKSEEQNQMLANYNDLEQKLKEEMVQKDEQIATLQIEMHELKNIISLSEEHSAMLENQVKELQEEVSQNDAQQKVSKLQQQVSEMESALNQVMTRNEELEAQMNLNTCEIEQRDRVMHEQNQVLKVRDELILLLKVKEQQQDKAISSLQATLEERDKNMEKVNKEIAIKSAELQELYSTLESKQVQVARLEKLVQQHEEQHDRSQKQRTRHEARIAELEETLQELRAPRYRQQQQQPVSCVGIENTKYAYTSKIKGRNCFTERPCRDQDPPRRRTECTATHLTQHDNDTLVITNTQTNKHELHNVCTDPPVGQKVTPKETPTKEQEHDVRYEIEQCSGGVPQTMSAHYSVTSIKLEEQNHKPNLHYTEESTKPTPPSQHKYLENMYKDDKHKQVTKDDQTSSDESENSEYKEQIFKALESRENRIHWIQTQLVKSDGSDVSGSENESVEANESGFWFTNKKDCIDSKMYMETIIKKIQVGEEMADHTKTKMMLPIKITPSKRCLQTHQKQMQNQDTHSQSVHSNTSSDHETTYVTNKDPVGMCKKQLDEVRKLGNTCVETIGDENREKAKEKSAVHKMIFPIKILAPRSCFQTPKKLSKSPKNHRACISYRQSTGFNTSVVRESTCFTCQDPLGMYKRQLDEVRISADLEEMSHSAPSLKGRFNSQSCGLNEQDWPSRTTHTERSYDTESESSEEERDVFTSSSILF